MNTRNTLSFLLTFILLGFLLTPVSAYTLDNGVCEGLDQPLTHVFDFDYLGDDVITTGVLITNETIDNTYHGDINGTAVHISVSGDSGDGFTMTYYGLDNSSVGIDIDTIEFDIYNYSFDNLVIGETILYYSNFTEDIQYALLYYPVFDLLESSGDHATLKFITRYDAYWWKTWIGNQTEITNYFDSPTARDWELSNFDLLQINFPPDYAQWLDGWNFDLAIDNMKVGSEENEFRTTDCVISYDTIADIPDYSTPYRFGHYINVEGKALFGEIEAFLNTNLFRYAILPDLDHSYYLVDQTGEVFTFSFVPYDSWYLNGVNGSHLSNGWINVTCQYWKDVDQNPTWFECFDGIENNYREATQQELDDVSNSLKIANDLSQFRDSGTLMRLNNYAVSESGNSPRFMYNNAYWSNAGELRHKAYYCDIGYSNCSHVNETWASVSNFSYSYYIFSSDTSTTEEVGFTNIWYFSGLGNDDLVNNQGLDVIAKGYGFKNIAYSGTGTGITGINYLYGNENINYIGNDLCEEFESYISTDWNYDQQCEIDRYGGLTGYAVVNNSRSLMLIAFVMIILGLIVTAFLVKENMALMLITILIMIALISIGINFMYSLW